ncbi:1441_t:CDS:2 [Paraglomus brasilianum]|uniref:Phosphatidyl-N-methylethanolamine N-methyltransferase n=1 Tax=Paraglomus brasilianum TaxID=144538 RepID=A0A9N9AB37_9GLOM|nr:1441_t:CDS:2 [Paraglomus brasilianum]
MSEFIDSIIASVDFSERTFWISFASITFNPLWWNIVARYEYKTHFITKLVGGNPYYGCYLLAAAIFGLGILRDYLYKNAIENQSVLPELDTPIVKTIASTLSTVGIVFVLSSMYALGLTGTYLGDYFGILMDTRVTSFPFNILEDPMYYGSTMIFLGTALWYASPSGILLTIWALICYLIALRFEGPFTASIYEKRDQERKAKKH